MQGMIARAIDALLRERLSLYPAVALVAPRQCGKTTLAQALDGRYYDLEQQPERLRLDLEWDDLASDQGDGDRVACDVREFLNRLVHGKS